LPVVDGSASTQHPTVHVVKTQIFANLIFTSRISVGWIPNKCPTGQLKRNRDAAISFQAEGTELPTWARNPGIAILSPGLTVKPLKPIFARVCDGPLGPIAATL